MSKYKKIFAGLTTADIFFYCFLEFKIKKINRMKKKLSISLFLKLKMNVEKYFFIEIVAVSSGRSKLHGNDKPCLWHKFTKSFFLPVNAHVLFKTVNIIKKSLFFLSESKILSLMLHFSLNSLMIADKDISFLHNCKGNNLRMIKIT